MDDLQYDRLLAERDALFHGRLTGVARVRDGRFVHVNDEFARIYGGSRLELENASAQAIELEAGAGPRGAPDQEGASAPRSFRYQREHTMPGGERRTLLIEVARLVGDAEHHDRLYTVVDITERERGAADLENARALLIRAVNSMSDGFVLFGADDRILLCNQVYASTLEGFGSAQSIVGMHVEDIVRQQIANGQPVPPEYAGDTERWVAERLAQHRRADGQPHVQQLTGGRWVQSIRHRTPDGGIVVLRSDITAFKDSEQAAQLLAQHDPLTGLPNRRLLHSRLAQALTRTRRASAIAAVLLIDLDGFKSINDTHGHEAGDEVLRVIANRLTAALRDADTVARFGGDEFIAVIDGVKHEADCGAVAAKIIDAVARPIPPIWTTLGHTAEVHINCSVGVSLYPRDATDPDTLVRMADAAMYQSKQAGPGRFVYHSAGV